MSQRVVVLDRDKCVGCQLCMFACSQRYGRAGLGKTAIWVHSAGDFERGFIIVKCRACPDPICAKVCPTGALVPRKGGGVFLKPDLCIGCGLCKDACTIGAIFWDHEQNRPVICVQCGYCVSYCPHGVLGIEKIGGEPNVKG